MGYLGIIIALFMTVGKDYSGSAWWDFYLDNPVQAEQWILTVCWWVFGIVLLITIVIGALSMITNSFEGLSVSISLGCFVVVLLVLQFVQWLAVFFAKGMANSVDPNGVVNLGQLIVCTFLYFCFGVGYSSSLTKVKKS